MSHCLFGLGLWSLFSDIYDKFSHIRDDGNFFSIYMMELFTSETGETVFRYEFSHISDGSNHLLLYMRIFTHMWCRIYIFRRRNMFFDVCDV